MNKNYDDYDDQDIKDLASHAYNTAQDFETFVYTVSNKEKLPYGCLALYKLELVLEKWSNLSKDLQAEFTTEGHGIAAIDRACISSLELKTCLVRLFDKFELNPDVEIKKSEREGKIILERFVNLKDTQVRLKEHLDKPSLSKKRTVYHNPPAEKKLFKLMQAIKDWETSSDFEDDLEDDWDGAKKRKHVKQQYEKYYAGVKDHVINHKVNINIQNEKGETPLILSVRNNWAELIKFFLEQDADINIIDTYGRSALIYAAQQGNHWFIMLLLKYPFEAYEAQQLLARNINITDKDGQTALTCGVRKGFSGVVNELLENKINLEIKDKWGRTPILWAAECGHPMILQNLIKHGGKYNVVDGQRYTPLMLVALHANHSPKVALTDERLEHYYKTLDILLEQPDLDIETKNSDDMTALMVASYVHNPTVLDKMMKDDAMRRKTAFSKTRKV